MVWRRSPCPSPCLMQQALRLPRGPLLVGSSVVCAVSQTVIAALFLTCNANSSRSWRSPRLEGRQAPVTSLPPRPCCPGPCRPSHAAPPSHSPVWRAAAWWSRCLARRRTGRCDRLELGPRHRRAQLRARRHVLRAGPRPGRAARALVGHRVRSGCWGPSRDPVQDGHARTGSWRVVTWVACRL